jgi:hypothetical protein
MLTLRQLAVDPGRLFSGLKKMERFNSARFEPDEDPRYPSLAERQRFSRAVLECLAGEHNPARPKGGRPHKGLFN